MSGCFSEWRTIHSCAKCLNRRAGTRSSRKRLGGSNQAAPLGTFDETSSETRADPLGPYLFWGHPHITYRRRASFWRGASPIARAHHLDDAVGDGGDVGD